MDPAWDTLYSATSTSLHTYTQRSAPCVCKVFRRCSLFRCGSEDDSKAEGSIAILQEVLQQRNFLKYINTKCLGHNVYTIHGNAPIQLVELACTQTFFPVCWHRNLNPRDPMNINLRKAFLEYDKNLWVLTITILTCMCVLFMVWCTYILLHVDLVVSVQRMCVLCAKRWRCRYLMRNWRNWWQSNICHGCFF